LHNSQEIRSVEASGSKVKIEVEQNLKQNLCQTVRYGLQ